MSETYKGEGFMTDWASAENSGEQAMPKADNLEWLRDFYNTHKESFDDDRERAVFRIICDEHNIRRDEAPLFLTYFKMGQKQMEVYLKQREAGFTKKEEQEKPQEPKIIPFVQKTEWDKPEHEDKEQDHKTAA